MTKIRNKLMYRIKFVVCGEVKGTRCKVLAFSTDKLIKQLRTVTIAPPDVVECD